MSGEPPRESLLKTSENMPSMEDQCDLLVSLSLSLAWTSETAEGVFWKMPSHVFIILAVGYHSPLALSLPSDPLVFLRR